MDREARGSRCSLCYDIGCNGGGCGGSMVLVGVGAHDTARGEHLWVTLVVCCLLGLGIFSACTVVPTGLHALVLPAVGKSMDVFQVEEGACRSWARQQPGGAPQPPPPGYSRSGMTRAYVQSMYAKGTVVPARGWPPSARTYRSFLVPYAFFKPPFAVCPGVHQLAVPARFAPRIPDVPDVVDDCIESGANEGGTPGDGPPTTCPAPAAAASPVPARSTTNHSPRRSRGTRWHTTEPAATSSCFPARPRQSGAPGPSLRHSCGACCGSG